MPSCEFDTGDLLHLLDAKTDVKSLKEIIPMMGVDLELMDDKVTQVEIFPNRPDMLTIEGFARALKGFMSVELGVKQYELTVSDIKLYVESSVDEIRPAYGAGLALNMDLDDYAVKSIMDMQEKLHLTHGRNRAKVAIGIHDLDKVTPPFTYKAVEPKSISFTPLEMSEPLTLKEILIKHPKGKDYAWTLEGKKKYPLFVDAKGEILSFPPIINGELSKLTENTRNIFLELTGTDQNAVNIALNIVATALADRGAKLKKIRCIRV